MVQVVETFLSPLLLVLDTLLDKIKIADLDLVLRSNHAFQQEQTRASSGQMRMVGYTSL
jgi:hypothetical protein